ncbi:DinB family protein [Hazenella sp. IB182353]|uniref:DinB family protein n=1 Tax=Polycladospora coralii TaxID=2771432 RepID=UPI00174665B4|nr:DinB family protein [Polycladospora coralii]MBS7531293.1 DinB family protein [Polycladospora coralii]
MFLRIEDFLQEWKFETQKTAQLFENLTDASLTQQVTDDHRTLGRIAWHMTVTLHELLSHTGLTFDGYGDTDEMPTSAVDIRDAYLQNAKSLVEALSSQWTDADLTKSSSMYGEEWLNGLTLRVLISHEIHHRGQLTVLARQAGLSLPDIYGPTRESWIQMGQEPLQ